MSEEFNHGKISQANVSTEMKASFLDYAMSVIVSRALPDVKDGLKPVHRRILYAMNDLGMTAENPYKKSARIVGDVIGKYHPHGDTAVYDSMVRMAQNFNYRYPLIDGHGNFGNIDGDGAAAMRYTEARMSKLSMEMIKDIKKDTVDFVDNYDGEESEPVVLPCKFPNLIVNGSTGIAVGMATNIPPHNLKETIDACIAIINNPDIGVIELMEIIKGPDFPTGALILGRSGIKQAYETGRGKIKLRAKYHLEEGKTKTSIIYTELPYQVNKANLIKDIADKIKAMDKEKNPDVFKALSLISDLRDESDKDGLRVVIELKKDAVPEIVVNQLFKHTSLQVTFGANILAIVPDAQGRMRPKLLPLIEIIKYFISFRNEVVVRRTKFELISA